MSNMASVIGRVAEIRGLVARMQAVEPAAFTTSAAPLTRNGRGAASAFSAALAQEQSGTRGSAGAAAGAEAETIGGSKAGTALATLAGTKQATRRHHPVTKAAPHPAPAATRPAAHASHATGAAVAAVSGSAVAVSKAAAVPSGASTFTGLTGVTAMTETEATTPATSTSTTPTSGGSTVASGGRTFDLALGNGADPRWADILARDVAYLQAGAHGPTSAQELNPIYAGTYPADVEARRRADGSLNPNDLPSSQGLTDDQLLLARLAESVPNAVLATGQNEGVAKAGATPSQNDAYDLLGWVKQLQDMATGAIPPLVQSNGYVWTKADIDRNLGNALQQVQQNKVLYNQRWASRWEMLRANGLGEIADAEQKTVQLADV